MCTDRHGEIKQFMQFLERRPEKIRASMRFEKSILV